jgi:hemerythrin
MKDLVWDNTLSVQIQEIDEDHRRLVDLFNLLGHAVEQGETPVYVEALFEELISGTIWHFKHEERLMIKYGYEGLQEHREEHDDLIENITALQKQRREEGKMVSSEDIVFLEHWLTGHILGADMDLGAYLAEVM